MSYINYRCRKCNGIFSRYVESSDYESISYRGILADKKIHDCPEGIQDNEKIFCDLISISDSPITSSNESNSNLPYVKYPKFGNIYSSFCLPKDDSVSIDTTKSKIADKYNNIIYILTYWDLLVISDNYAVNEDEPDYNIIAYENNNYNVSKFGTNKGAIISGENYLSLTLDKDCSDAYDYAYILSRFYNFIEDQLKSLDKQYTELEKSPLRIDYVWHNDQFKSSVIKKRIEKYEQLLKCLCIFIDKNCGSGFLTKLKEKS